MLTWICLLAALSGTSPVLAQDESSIFIEGDVVVLNPSSDEGIPLQHFIQESAKILDLELVYETPETSNQLVPIRQQTRIQKTAYDGFFQEMLFVLEHVMLPVGSKLTSVRDRRTLARTGLGVSQVISLDELRARREHWIQQAARYVTVVAPLQHAPVGETREALQGLLSYHHLTRMAILPERNALAVTLRGPEAVRLADFLELADRSSPFTFRAFEVKSLSAKDAAAVIESFLKQRRAASKGFGRPETVVVLPDSRIMVHAAPSVHDVVGQLIREIDS